MCVNVRVILINVVNEPFVRKGIIRNWLRITCRVVRLTTLLEFRLDFFNDVE